MTIHDPAGVLHFWRAAGMGKWFRGGVEFDDACRVTLGDAHFAAARRELDGWMAEAGSALALVLLLDQVPRNIFRGSGHAFATDGAARLCANRAIAQGFDARVESAMRMFFYLPFEHSEDPAEQQRSLELFAALGDAGLLGYATAHRDVIAKFGRFPHRNAALGRINTPEEQAWLDAGGGF